MSARSCRRPSPRGVESTTPASDRRIRRALPPGGSADDETPPRPASRPVAARHRPRCPGPAGAHPRREAGGPGDGRREHGPADPDRGRRHPGGGPERGRSGGRTGGGPLGPHRAARPHGCAHPPLPDRGDPGRERAERAAPAPAGRHPAGDQRPARARGSEERPRHARVRVHDGPRRGQRGQLRRHRAAEGHRGRVDFRPDDHQRREDHHPAGRPVPRAPARAARPRRARVPLRGHARADARGGPQERPVRREGDQDRHRRPAVPLLGRGREGAGRRVRPRAGLGAAHAATEPECASPPRGAWPPSSTRTPRPPRPSS
jgi:hypothetical protein